MNYYLFIYTFSITSFLVGGIIFWAQYKNLSGFFFFISTLLASIWFILYFLFFSGFFDEHIMLYLSRADYAVSVLGVYSFLLFIYLFPAKKISFAQKRNIIVLSVSLAVLVLSLYLFTNSIISGLSISDDNVYREVPGRYIYLHFLFHGTFALSFVYLTISIMNRLTHLERIRLKNIAVLFYITILILFLLQLVLPYFGVWVFEKEIILLFFLFVSGTIYTIKRYYFPRIGYGIRKIANVITSLVISISLTNFIHKFYEYSLIGELNGGYWYSGDDYDIVMVTSSITFFLLSYYLLDRLLFRRFFGLANDNILRVFTSSLQKNISRLTTFGAMQTHIQRELKKIIGTSFTRIITFGPQPHFTEFKRYFESDGRHPVFINDMVFIEENSRYFDKKIIMEQIPTDTALIFPFYDEARNNTGLFILGQKPFGDFYTQDEIESLKQISLFIESHIRYLKTYEQIQDFSRNLDKKVDEKTIEYNDLINKQKEFISTISHEIKSPIAGAILQTDSIMDDMANEKIPRTKIADELNLLSVQLVKVGDLLSKLFSVQYYDTHAVTLFREKVQIQNMLNMEFDIYESIHENVEFIREIDSDMRFIEIDKIQFQQVITNLVNNAIKFSRSDHPKVRVEAYIKGHKFHFSVEDNGDGFEGIAIEEIFDKYAVGESGSAGLGLGLYLCKRIVEMHKGHISASKGDYLSGAKISIELPI